MKKEKTTYGKAICEGFQYLMSNYDKVFVIGQGVTSPWYVGSTMTDLNMEFGDERVIDTPVSELAVTGAAVGASLCGYRPVVIHPRMDFMVLASDQIVSQAAKWSYMLGGQSGVPVTIRGIINRGGEQGAQHSQALHSWYAHIPGLRVVMPATPEDARDLLISSVMCDDPVLYIDDRWLYDIEQELPPIAEKDLSDEIPRVLIAGKDVTLVGCGYTTQLCLEASGQLEREGISCEVIDLRVLNPMNSDTVIESVKKTGYLCAVDGGWSTCGLAGEIIATVMERIEPSVMKASPVRLTLPDAPAPTSRVLENIYYLKAENIVDTVNRMYR